MELIFIRDGSFDIAGNDASLYSCDDINLFISLICTDVRLSPVYCTFVCKINNNNNNNDIYVYNIVFTCYVFVLHAFFVVLRSLYLYFVKE